jgi:hypothetical protein
VCWLQIPGVCTHRSTSGDHVIPIKYRPDLALTRSNIRGACGPCNRKRGDLTIEQLNEIYYGTTTFNTNASTNNVAQQQHSAPALRFFEAEQTRDTCRDYAVRTESGVSPKSGV